MAVGQKARPVSIFDKHRPTIDAEHATTLTSVQDRVEYIADLMADGSYVTRKTCRELRDAWDLSMDRITQMRNSAAILMRASLGKTDELRTKACATLDAIRVEALYRGRNEDAPAMGPDMSFKWYEVALQASVAMLRFTDREVDETVEREKRDAEKNPAAETTTFKVEFVTPERPKSDPSA